MFLIDYHIHSLYSNDSKASLEAIGMQAIQSGIKEIAITDHFEPTPLDDLYKRYDPKGQRLDIDYHRDMFRGELLIRQGIELGQPHLHPELCDAILRQSSFDYVIGSVHKNHRGIDAGDYNYRDYGVEFMIWDYLREVRDMVLDNRFDCLGHLDLPRRYAAKQEVFFSMTDYIDAIAEIFDILIRNDKGIEVNTSGLRHELSSMMPEKSILRLYKDLGGKIITVGSDAHHSAHVGSYITTAYELIKSVGFKEITTFHQREPQQIPILGHHFFPALASEQSVLPPNVFVQQNCSKLTDGKFFRELY